MNIEIEDLLQKINNEVDIISDKLNLSSEMLYSKEINKLNSLIGLKEVKEEVNKLVNYLIFMQKVKNEVILDRINLNMIFKGNPGTGKTTVARIIANVLYDLGYIKNNTFKEATPRDFIAGYVGQTAIKTQELLEEYSGGLIFVDEAYGFVAKDNENNFSDDAFTEIIKEMEKKETAFIFAGYNDEMDDFLNLNQGIKSRIGYIIDFKDYSEEELLEMFLKKIKESNLKITESSLNLIKYIIKVEKQEKNFGNGRMIDNLYNKIIIEHASINKKENDIEKLLIITDDSIKRVIDKNYKGVRECQID